MRTILLKYPTRERPFKFMKNFERYMELASGKHKIIYLISMDTDDSSMNNDNMRRYFSKFQDQDIRLDYGTRQGKIAAINRNIPTEEWDILISTADDMEPQIVGWDDHIVKDFYERFQDSLGALNYDTDPRLDAKGPEGYKTLITLPVIGRKLYDRFGYIYHPSYRSEYCDDEQTQVFSSLGLLQHIKERPIKHFWEQNQDALMMKNMREGFEHDRSNYLKRKENHFHD